MCQISRKTEMGKVKIELIGRSEQECVVMGSDTIHRDVWEKPGHEHMTEGLMSHSLSTLSNS